MQSNNQPTVTDTEALDWIGRQGDKFSTGILINQPGDGDYYVHGFRAYGQGTTFREALFLAITTHEIIKTTV